MASDRFQSIYESTVYKYKSQDALSLGFYKHAMHRMGSEHPPASGQAMLARRETHPWPAHRIRRKAHIALQPASRYRRHAF